MNIAVNESGQDPSYNLFPQPLPRGPEGLVLWFALTSWRVSSVYRRLVAAHSRFQRFTEGCSLIEFVFTAKTAQIPVTVGTSKTT